MGWHHLFSRGTLVVGDFAERAEVDGFAYYNTAFAAGDKYPDRASKFLSITPSYILLTVTSSKLTAEIKGLDGTVQFAAPQR